MQSGPEGVSETKGQFSTVEMKCNCKNIYISDIKFSYLSKFCEKENSKGKASFKHKPPLFYTHANQSQ